MSWRLDINHITRYRYDRPVVASYNEARVTPLPVPDQLVIDAQVAVRPPAELFCYRDYWGALVHCFDVHVPHQSLIVTSRAVVETAPLAAGRTGAEPDDQRPGGGTGSAGWPALSEPGVADRFYEFVAPSRLVTPHDLAGPAGELRARYDEPGEAVPAVLDWVHDQLEYGTGATHVHTSASEAWRAGKGVCQDFAHLTLAVLRAMGIPARYVSGYFYPDEKGVVGAKVLGESHAWVEAWTGGWASHDPTNRVQVGERHVVVARGRDYADVAPVRGIYSGPPCSSSEVTVELTRRA